MLYSCLIFKWSVFFIPPSLYKSRNWISWWGCMNWKWNLAAVKVKQSFQATELSNICYSILWLRTHSTIDLTLPIIKMKIYKSFIFPHFQTRTGKHLWHFASLCNVHTGHKLFLSPNSLSLESVFLGMTTWTNLNILTDFSVSSFS